MKWKCEKIMLIYSTLLFHMTVWLHIFHGYGQLQDCYYYYRRRNNNDRNKRERNVAEYEWSGHQSYHSDLIHDRSRVHTNAHLLHSTHTYSHTHSLIMFSVSLLWNNNGLVLILMITIIRMNHGGGHGGEGDGDLLLLTLQTSWKELKLRGYIWWENYIFWDSNCGCDEDEGEGEGRLRDEECNLYNAVITDIYEWMGMGLVVVVTLIFLERNRARKNFHPGIKITKPHLPAVKWSSFSWNWWAELECDCANSTKYYHRVLLWLWVKQPFCGTDYFFLHHLTYSPLTHMMYLFK